MADDKILCEKRGDATHITLNRADCGGLVSDPMAVELADMIDAAAAESKYIVFRSAGADFCLGRDPEGREPGKPKDALDSRRRSEVVFNFTAHSAGRRCRSSALRRAAPSGSVAPSRRSATLPLQEKARHSRCRRWGTTSCRPWRCRRWSTASGRKGALYLTYSTEEIDAQTALAYGLVSRVVPDDRIEAQVELVCAALDKAPLPAVMSVKEYATNALTMSIEQASDFARNMHAAVNTSEGMRR